MHCLITYVWGGYQKCFQWLVLMQKFCDEVCNCFNCYLQGCSSPIVVKFADTQKDKEQKRIAQQLQQQMQQISAASVWGNLAGLNTLGPQYLAVSF